jgi:hypothetical protein
MLNLLVLEIRAIEASNPQLSVSERHPLRARPERAIVCQLRLEFFLSGRTKFPDPLKKNEGLGGQSLKSLPRSLGQGIWRNLRPRPCPDFASDPQPTSRQNEPSSKVEHLTFRAT